MRFLSRKKKPAVNDSELVSQEEAASLQQQVLSLQSDIQRLYKAIAVINQLAGELDINSAMQNVRQVALELLECDRVTLFLIFERRQELRGLVPPSAIIRLPFGEGIAGRMAQTGGLLNVPDAYSCPIFNPEIDKLTGYHTRSLLCCTITDQSGRHVAVLQALNKRAGGAFTPADEQNLRLFGAQLGNTLVKAKLAEDARHEKERLTNLYSCFKSLNAAGDLGAMLCLTSSSLEGSLLRAEAAFVFLLDAPRGELWLLTHESATLRTKLGTGVVGKCAVERQQMCIADFDGQDNTLARLQSYLPEGQRAKCLLAQPIQAHNTDKVMGVLVAVNKQEQDGEQDIFFEPVFTDADCDAMAIFAYELGDLMAQHALELSLMSAMSTVGHNGTHVAASTQPSLPNTQDFETTTGTCRYSLPHNEHGGSVEVVAGSETSAPAGSGQGGGEYSSSALREHSIASTTAGVESSSPECVSGLASRMHAHSPMGRAAAGVGHVPSGGTVNGTGLSDEEVLRSQLLQMYLPQSKKDIGGGSLTTRSGSRYGNASLFAAGCASAGGSILGGSMQRGSRFTVASKSTPRSAFASRQGPFSTRPGVMALASSTGASVSILSPHSEGANQEKSYPGTFNSSVSNRAHTDGNVHLPEALLEESVQGVPSKSGGAQLQGGRAPASGTQSAVGRSHGALLPNEAAAAPASASMADGPSTSSSRNLASQGPLLRVRENEGTDDEELDELEQRLSPHARSRYQAGPGPGSSSLGLQIRAGFGPGGGHHVAGGGGSGSGFGRGGGGGQMAGNSSKRAVVRSMPNMMEGVSVVDNGPQFYTMSFINSWDSEFTSFHGDELIQLAHDIFICSGLVAAFNINQRALRAFLTAVASHYQVVPYHNFNHVLHVLHGVYMIVSTTRASEWLRDEDRLALLIAALCHDLDHDGRSNSYHVNSGSQLARIYNDVSVLENHHCAMTFAILSRKECDLFFGLSPELQKALRKKVIAAILCTDMANHFAVTADFQKHPLMYDPASDADRTLLVKIVLHAADIGNAVRPFVVNHIMSRRVHKEFQCQAEAEAAQELPVTMSVDVADPKLCASVELNFLDYVVTALWERLAEVLPELQPRMKVMKENRAKYQAIMDTGVVPIHVEDPWDSLTSATEPGTSSRPQACSPAGTATFSRPRTSMPAGTGAGTGAGAASMRVRAPPAWELGGSGLGMVCAASAVPATLDIAVADNEGSNHVGRRFKFATWSSMKYQVSCDGDVASPVSTGAGHGGGAGSSHHSGAVPTTGGVLWPSAGQSAPATPGQRPYPSPMQDGACMAPRASAGADPGLYPGASRARRQRRHSLVALTSSLVNVLLPGRSAGTSRSMRRASACGMGPGGSEPTDGSHMAATAGTAWSYRQQSMPYEMPVMQPHALLNTGASQVAYTNNTRTSGEIEVTEPLSLLLSPRGEFRRAVTLQTMHPHNPYGSMGSPLSGSPRASGTLRACASGWLGPRGAGPHAQGAGSGEMQSGLANGHASQHQYSNTCAYVDANGHVAAANLTHGSAGQVPQLSHMSKKHSTNAELTHASSAGQQGGSSSTVGGDERGTPRGKHRSAAYRLLGRLVPSKSKERM